MSNKQEIHNLIKLGYKAIGRMEMQFLMAQGEAQNISFGLFMFLYYLQYYKCNDVRDKFKEQLTPWLPPFMRTWTFKTIFATHNFFSYEKSNNQKKLTFFNTSRLAILRTFAVKWPHFLHF